MPDYKYRAALKDGKVIRGKVVAVNKSQAINKLKVSQIQPIAIKRMRDYKKPKKSMFKVNSQLYKNIKLKPEDANMARINLDSINPFKRITSKDIIMFVNNLYILKKAKFNNIQALQSIFDGTENPVFKDIVEDILIGVEAGERLNTVMANYPHIFPPMFINFIRVGEESGSLDTALLHARDYIEDSNKLKKEIKKAVVPKVLQFVLIMGAMIVGLMIGVPIIKDVYAMFGSTQEVPPATMAAFNAVEWSVANWYYIVAVIVLIFVAFFGYMSTPRGRYKIDKLLLTIPVLGNLNTNITMSKFFQAMLLNLKNGMRIQESLEVSKSVSNNYYFLSIAEVGKSNALTGGSWITPFEEHNVFKPMVSEMLNIGMKTDLAEMMEKVNEYIQMEIKESLDRFVKFLPEITYLVVGIALIAFLITVMVPIINIYMGTFIEVPS